MRLEKKASRYLASHQGCHPTQNSVIIILPSRFSRSPLPPSLRHLPQHGLQIPSLPLAGPPCSSPLPPVTVTAGA
ncbi:hypothetical protein E2C01_066201 [Portunus trituberculatus]|uniref:Uncharacterized protein n=1 Tax=Portunus trituberculatus TaxID=210409 RepID=A0A5B7HQB1_PORTR|nr:hypothetical protein [Portunus trituberculatus]